MATTPEQKAAFLETLEETGLINKSCRAAGFTYPTYSQLRTKDREFDEACEAAKRAHGEAWEVACRERGIEGWLEPRFNKEGEVVGHVRRFSDRCLELGLKRFCPEYREKLQVDATISGGVLVVNAPMAEDEWVERYGGAKRDD